MMAGSHIFTLPSVTAPSGDEEGMGVALVEAQAAGLPVVATLHGPFPEVVRDGITGFLVGRNPEALADRLVYLADNPKIAEAIGAAGRRNVENKFDERALAPLGDLSVVHRALPACVAYADGSEWDMRMPHRHLLRSGRRKEVSPPARLHRMWIAHSGRMARNSAAALVELALSSCTLDIHDRQLCQPVMCSAPHKCPRTLPQYVES